MATRAKTPSPAKTPASGKTKSATPSKPVAKTAAAPGKLAQPAARAKGAAGGKPALKAAVAPAKVSGVVVKKPVAPAASAKAAKPPRPAVSEEQRRNYIEVAAYYIAERRGFFGASALEDWTRAELEVDQMLREGKLNP